MDELETFEFHKDTKHTIWYTGTFEISAKSFEEAVEIVKSMSSEQVDDLICDNGGFETLYETLEDFTVKENGGMPTEEIHAWQGANDILIKHNGVDKNYGV